MEDWTPVSRRSSTRLALGLGLFALAVALGFLASSQVGERWMREEAEFQLGRLLDADVRIERIGLRLRYGIEVHGTGITASYANGREQTLTASTASVSFETASLLVGRLRIARLELDQLAVPLARDLQGAWSPDYGRGRKDESRSDPEGLEAQLNGLRGLIGAVHFLLRDQKIADHIVLRDASIEILDERPRAGAREPVRIRLEGIEGQLDRSWLRGESDLALRGHWVEPGANPAPVEVAGRWRDRDSDLHMAFAFTGIELGPLRPYLLTPGRTSDIAGRVSGVIAVVTPERERGRVELDWSFDELESEIPIGDTRLRLSSPLETLQVQLSLEPRRVRLEAARLQGQSIEVRMRGNATRPLATDSLVTLNADLSRMELRDLRRLVSGLPPAEAEPFLVLLDRMASGHVRTVGVRGGASLAEWQELLAGRRSSLPNTLRVEADIEDVTMGTSPTDTISDVSARISFSGEAFEMHGFEGKYNGEPLPRVDFAVSGIGVVLGDPMEGQQLTRRARPLPGLGTLWDIVRGDPSKDPEHPPSPIRLHLDEFQHPALRWPLRNAQIAIDPTERDLHITIQRGEWAGHPILGEAILDRGPDAELRIELIVADGRAEPAPSPAAPPDAEGGEPLVDAEVAALESGEPPSGAGIPKPPVADRDAPWAHGRFESSGIHTGPIAFEWIQGSFALRGQTLALSDVYAELLGGGELTLAASLALDRGTKVPIGAELEVHDAEADRVAQIFGLTPGFATGRADVRGQLAGPIRPGKGLIDKLVGRIVIDARDGELQQKVPLLAAVSHAIEGWSPAAASETLRYEQIETTIDFARGRISTDRFALEGPLRILASGIIDLNEDPVPVDATFGFFLLRQADRLLGDIPLVNLLIPGSDRGLIGAYFEASGPVDDPSIRPLPMKSIAQGVPLPEVLRQPFDALQELFSGATGSKTDRNGASP